MTRGRGTRPRVLFVSHDATVTGAPRALLHLLSWLRARDACEPYVVLREDGPWRGEFEAAAPTLVLRPAPASLPGRAARFARRRGLLSSRLPSAALERLRTFAAEADPDVVVSNTSTNGEVLEVLAPAGVAVVCVVHEMSRHLSRPGAEGFARTLACTDRFVAVSEAVRREIVARGADPDRVAVAHEFVPVIPLGPGERTAARADLRARLGLGADAVVVLGCGTADLRKGVDLFVGAASACARRAPGLPLAFVWVGDEARGGLARRLAALQFAGGVAADVRFVGRQEAPRQWMLGADVFVLPSREDPYPLVMLEAASCGLPVVAFRGGGGAPEFVEDDAGALVDAFDADELAAAVLRLTDDRALRERMGACGARRVKERHDLDVGAARLWDVVSGAIPAHGARR